MTDRSSLAWIHSHADDFAELLGMEEGSIYFDSNGVRLSPTVAEEVLARLRTAEQSAMLTRKHEGGHIESTGSGLTYTETKYVDHYTTNVVVSAVNGEPSVQVNYIDVDISPDEDIKAYFWISVTLRGYALTKTGERDQRHSTVRYVGNIDQDETRYELQRAAVLESLSRYHIPHDHVASAWLKPWGEFRAEADAALVQRYEEARGGQS